MFLETVTLKVIIKDNFIIIQTTQIPGIIKRVETIIHHQIIHLAETQDLLSQEAALSVEVAIYVKIIKKRRRKKIKFKYMKQIIISIFIAITSLSSFAQDYNDALRYADDNLQGTSRYQAMGGAFGALGGDLTAFAHNPAGSAVYNYGQFWH